MSLSRIRNYLGVSLPSIYLFSKCYLVKVLRSLIRLLMIELISAMSKMLKDTLRMR